MVKTILALAFVVILGLIIIDRQRVYLRDPIATVYRNDAPQSGIQVYQNYSNDILIEDDGDNPFRILVQHWNQTPGTPVRLTCMRWMACLAGADQAAIQPLHWNGKGKYDPQVTMTNRDTWFTDVDGSKLHVQLR